VQDPATPPVPPQLVLRLRLALRKVWVRPGARASVSD
jgi:hypothetical protein